MNGLGFFQLELLKWNLAIWYFCSFTVGSQRRFWKSLARLSFWINILLGHQEWDEGNFFSAVGSCSVDFSLQMTLGFFKSTGEEPCEWDRTVCYCCKCKSKMQTCSHNMGSSGLLYFNCSLLKQMWLKFRDVILCSLFPSVAFCPCPAWIILYIKRVMCLSCDPVKTHT